MDPLKLAELLKQVREYCGKCKHTCKEDADNILVFVNEFAEPPLDFFCAKANLCDFDTQRR